MKLENVLNSFSSKTEEDQLLVLNVLLFRLMRIILKTDFSIVNELSMSIRNQSPLFINIENRLIIFMKFLINVAKKF